MIRRLRHTFNTKPTPNEEEDLYVRGWSLISEESERLLNESWKLQQRGKQVEADRLNQAGNYLMYLFYYALFMRNWVDRQGLIEDQCTATLVEDNFKIACVEDNLSCLSINLGTDYVSVWKELLDIFGISRQTEGCGECCLGIGEMIIDSNDDCVGFIIGPCDENIVEDEAIGEYEDCTFDDSHTTADADACGLTTNCN